MEFNLRYMKNIFATFSLLLFLSVYSFGQIKFDDAFKINKKRSCYDLNIEKIDISKKQQKENSSTTLKIEVLINNIGTMTFEQSADACLELYDITGTEKIKLESWDFNNLNRDEAKTFEWTKSFSIDEPIPSNFEAKIVLNGSFGECNLFNNSRLEDCKK